MDDSINPGSGSDKMTTDVELPVEIATLSIDGTAPAVGDPVKLIVRGNVTRVVNDTAYVKPEYINDQPMKPALDADPMLAEEERLRRLSETTDETVNGY